MALRDDLQNMRKAALSERAALQHEMFIKSLAGDYGDVAKNRAGKLRQLVDETHLKRSRNGVRAAAAAFWARAVRWFRHRGIKKITCVLTDNGSCYRSFLFVAALAKSRTRRKRTRPYRPQTNGKVEPRNACALSPGPFATACET